MAPSTRSPPTMVQLQRQFLRMQQDFERQQRQLEAARAEISSQANELAEARRQSRSTGTATASTTSPISSSEFGLSPALVRINDKIDYQTKEGSAIYAISTSALLVKLDITTPNVTKFRNLLSDRAEAFGWDK